MRRRKASPFTLHLGKEIRLSHLGDLATHITLLFPELPRCCSDRIAAYGIPLAAPSVSLLILEVHNTWPVHAGPSRAIYAGFMGRRPEKALGPGPGTDGRTDERLTDHGELVPPGGHVRSQGQELRKR